jgi:hypothetical protein
MIKLLLLSIIRRIFTALQYAYSCTYYIIIFKIMYIIVLLGIIIDSFDITIHRLSHCIYSEHSGYFHCSSNHHHHHIVINAIIKMIIILIVFIKLIITLSLSPLLPPLSQSSSSSLSSSSPLS